METASVIYATVQSCRHHPFYSSQINDMEIAFDGSESANLPVNESDTTRKKCEACSWKAVTFIKRKWVDAKEGGREKCKGKKTFYNHHFGISVANLPPPPSLPIPFPQPILG